jgi:hypothetical protein
LPLSDRREGLSHCVVHGKETKEPRAA